MRQPQIDPGHTGKRRVLRIIGPVVLLLGIMLTAIGFLTVVMGDPFDHPGMAALPFIGMPLMFVGAVCSMMGFMGAVARYQANEYAPIAKDTFNYIAEETQDGVRTVASAIGEGLRGETRKTDGADLTCPDCGAPNEPGSKFCDQCGKPLPRDAVCPGCGEANDPDARFCDRCGRAISGV
jgi:hypothetical protein